MSIKCEKTTIYTGLTIGGVLALLFGISIVVLYSEGMK